MIIYTCPNCGEPLSSYVVTTNPPINVTECRKCGWRKETKPDGVIFVPFPEEEK